MSGCCVQGTLHAVCIVQTATEQCNAHEFEQAQQQDWWVAVLHAQL